MCGFKPGDEVTLSHPVVWRSGKAWRFGPLRWRRQTAGPLFGEICVVREVVLAGGFADVDECFAQEIMVRLAEWPGEAFSACNFRKIQRRDLTVWLATENTIDNPNPIRRRKRADA